MVPRLLSLVALVLSFGACTTAPSAISDDDAVVGGPWAAWHDYPLPGKRRTSYRSERSSDRFIVRAHAEASASMFRRQTRIESSQLAGLQFSWRAASLIEHADLSQADVSDSPVSIVLAFDGDHGRLSSRNRMLFDLAQALMGEPPPYATLMYVWDNRAAPESVILSPRTDRVRKIVVESGPSRVGQWLQYERDVLADFRRAFGEEPSALIGVALMTDADNTGSRASGDYGEVRLMSRDGKSL